MATTRQMSREKLIEIIKSAKELGVQKLKYGELEVVFNPYFDDVFERESTKADRISYEQRLFDDGSYN